MGFVSQECQRINVPHRVGVVYFDSAASVQFGNRYWFGAGSGCQWRPNAAANVGGDWETTTTPEAMDAMSTTLLLRHRNINPHLYVDIDGFIPVMEPL